jgi:hypothetical protein
MSLFLKNIAEFKLSIKPFGKHSLADLEDTGYEIAGWIHLVMNGFQWLTLVDTSIANIYGREYLDRQRYR